MQIHTTQHFPLLMRKLTEEQCQEAKWLNQLDKPRVVLFSSVVSELIPLVSARYVQKPNHRMNG